MNLKSAPQDKLFIWNRSNVLQLKDTDTGIYPESRYHYRGRSPLSVIDYLAAHLGKTEGLSKADILQNSITIHDFYSQDFPITGVEVEVDGDVYVSLLRKWDVEQLAVVDIDSPGQYCLQVYDLAGGLRELQSQEVDNNFFTHNAGKLLAEVGLESKFRQLKLSPEKKTAWLLTGELAYFMKSEVLKTFLNLFTQIGASLPLLNYCYYDKYQLLNTARHAKLSVEGYLEEAGISALNSQLIAAKSSGGISLHTVGSTESVLAINSTKRPQLHRIESPVNIMGISGLQVSTGYLWTTGSSSNSKRGAVEASDDIWQDKRVSANHDSSATSVKDIELDYSAIVLKPWKLPFSKTEQDRKILQKNFKSKAIIFLDRVKKQDLNVVQGQKVIQGEQLNQKTAVSLLFETKAYEAPISGVVDLRDFDKGIIQIISDKTQLEDFHWASSATRNPSNIYHIETISLPLTSATGLSSWGRVLLAETKQEAAAFAAKASRSIIVCDFILSVKDRDDLYQAGATVVISVYASDKLLSLGISRDYRGMGGFGSTGFTLPKKYRKYLNAAQISHGYFNAASRELYLSSVSSVGNGKSKFAMSENTANSIKVRMISKGDTVLLINCDYPFQEAKVQSVDDGEIRVKLHSSGKLIALGQEHLFLL